MSPKTSPKSATGHNNESERVALTKALKSLENTQEEFIHAIEKIENMKSQTLTDYTLEIDDLKKQREDRMADLENDYKVRNIEIQNDLKNSKIEADHLLKQYRHDGAIEILRESGEEAVDSDELEELKNANTESEATHQDELVKLKKELESKGNQDKHCALDNLQLRHKAEVAQLTAENDMAKRELVSARSSITDLKEQVREQQQLTKDVAEASRSGAISQNFGK